jgi:glyoxylase-like metal-dependent hydrolase (beta-lactamase superfamily II)
VARTILPGLHGVFFPRASVNAFLIETAGGLVLVDAGIISRRGASILRAATRLGKQPSDIRAIAVTHYHSDHIGNLGALVEATGAEVYAHPLEAEVIRTGAAYPHGKPVDALSRIFGTIFAPLVPKRSERSPVHHEVVDGGEIQMAGLRAIHTPGHTPGHLSFLWPEQGGVLIAGDVLGNSMGMMQFSVQYQDFAQAKESLRKLAVLDFDKAVFGHGRLLKGKANAAFRRFVERRGA